MTPPTTKKLLLRSYRPLSDLLKKPLRDSLQWSEDLHARFELLKQALTSGPIFRLPDPSQTFVLRIDALIDKYLNMVPS